MYLSKKIKIISLLLCFSFIINVSAQAVEVKNVSFIQRGEEIWITYDLDGQSGKKYSIELSVSEDYGFSYRIDPRAVTGDIGRGISPGVNKQIRWYFMEDYPEGLEGSGFVFAVEAKRQRGSRWPLYVIGCSVVGSTIYFLAKEASPKTGSIVITVPDNR